MTFHSNSLDNGDKNKKAQLKRKARGGGGKKLPAA